MELFSFLNQSHPGSCICWTVRTASQPSVPSPSRANTVRGEIPGTHWFLLSASEDSSIPAWVLARGGEPTSAALQLLSKWGQALVLGSAKEHLSPGQAVCL